MYLRKALTFSTITISLLLSGCAFFSTPEREPYYPLLSEATYSDDEIAVIESNNVLKSAIKQNALINLEKQNEIEASFSKVFAEVENSEGFSFEDLKTPSFHQALKTIVQQFSCEVYASQQDANTIQLCPQHEKIVDNNLPYLPFKDGGRVIQRLITDELNEQGTLQLEMFLKSTHERPLESLWGAVHELGRFKGSQLPAESLVLTINLSAYKKDHYAHAWRSAYHEPLIFFVVLPPVDEISEQPNEIASMAYSFNNAKLIAADSRE
jgi:hypothetical protein